MTTEPVLADIGDEIPPMEWTPDSALVQNMMGLSGWIGEDNREPGSMSGPNRFTDHGAARSEGFGNMIVPGNLGMMAMAAAIQAWLPNGYVSKLDCVFRQPVSQGETLTATGIVTDRQDHPDKVVLELDVFLLREDNQRPQGGTAIVTIETSPN